VLLDRSARDRPYSETADRGDIYVIKKGYKASNVLKISNKDSSQLAKTANNYCVI